MTPTLPPGAEAWAIDPRYLHQARIIRAAEVKPPKGDQLILDADASRRASETEAAVQAAQGSRTAGGTAVIPIKGIVRPEASLMSILFGGGGFSLKKFRSQLNEQLANDDVGSIVLDINSPGGTTDLVPEVAEDIREARAQKPIIAVVNTLAASAAYWLGSQASEMVVTPSGEAGSIGVFIMHTDFSEMDAQMGIKTTIIRSGKYKAEANPYEPLTEDAQEHLQSQSDTFYEMFTEAVAAGRKVSKKKVVKDFGEGRTFLAEEAVESGMVDSVATLEETIARVAGGKPRVKRKVESDEDTAARAREGRALLLARERRL